MNEWVKKWLEKNDLHGIDLCKMKKGTKVKVITKNSIYEFVVVDGQKVIVKGGKFFPTPVEAELKGSTFNKKMKIGWIGFMMNMNIITEGRLVTTSSVQSATVFSPEGDWLFNLDWPDPFYQ